MKMDELPEQAKTAYKFDNTQEPLMSIPVLWDNGFTVTFTKQSVHVNKEKKVLTGYREPTTKLWRFPHAENTPPSGQQVEPRINKILPDGTMSDTLNFLHLSMGSPTKNTLLNALRKNSMSMWPFFTENNIAKFIPDSIPTDLGHQDRTRKNAHYTQQSTYKSQENKYINIYAAINQPEIPTENIHSYQTVRFTVQSSSGKKYMMVIYAYDPNSILVEPLLDRSKESIMQDYQKIIQHLIRRGFKPRLQRLDNEASKLFQDEMDNQQIQWQLVPPGNHRRNAAERQICTFKNHFISILARTDPYFSLHLWDKLIPHACITINLLRNSHRNPQLSAEAHLNGNFDYNTAPLAPPGTKIVAF